MLSKLDLFRNIISQSEKISDFEKTENKETILEDQLHRSSASITKEVKETSDWSPESSPTPKHRQNQIQKDSKNESAKDGDDITVYKDFDSMGLSDELLRGIYAYGYEKPSVVQQRAIVPCISGRDVVAQAQSGTGKTATFSISLLQQIDMSKKHCQAMILTPTRELARQTQTDVLALGDYLGVDAHLVVGGERVLDMKHRLNSGVQVIVGTPGRVKHMINDGALDTRHIKILVLDEVDVMLSRGFEEQVKDIFLELPNRDLQVITVTATLPPEVLRITDRFMRNAMHILIKDEEVPLEAIRQFYVDVDREEFKFDTLCDIYGSLSIDQSIIFCNSCRKVDMLADYMTSQDFTVSRIHADQPPEERKRVVKEFRNGASRVLIATDVLQRGMDFQQVSMVCNIDLPHDKDSYIHRIGRCGRFGRKGVAISLITKKDYPAVRSLEQYYSIHINEMPRDIANYL